MAPPIFLVTGISGLLGPYLYEGMSVLGPTIGAARSAGDEICDFLNSTQIESLMARVKPDFVIHAAAMTDVDWCERDPDLAFQTNAHMVSHITKLMPNGARLILISTDQVYSDTQGPHNESNANPINVYGRSKFAGELEALKRPKSLVLRTNFFGPSKTINRLSLSDWLTKALTEHQPVTLFEDVQFSPLHMATLTELIATMVTRSLAGVFNLGCRDGMTKKDFGLLLAKHMDLSTGTVSVDVSTNLPGRAARPLDLRMNVAKAERALAISMPTLCEEIGRL